MRADTWVPDSGEANLDPDTLILTGGSSGGTLTWGTACDPNVTTLFKGYGPVSGLETITVADGGQQWPGLDDASNGAVDTNGFNTAQRQWDIFSTRSW